MIDEIDRKILKELQQDARTSYAELGRRVGLTTPAVIERVRKLEDAQIITGYRADIDTSKVGLPIMAVGLASLVCAWAYSYGPAPISASPSGEFFVILFFGVAATTGIVWLAAGAFDATTIVLGVAVGLPAAAVLTINNHRDRAQDAADGRRTLAILLGARGTVALYGCELAAAALIAAYALWPLSGAAVLVALVGCGASIARALRLAHVPISRALNAELVATVRF